MTTNKNTNFLKFTDKQTIRFFIIFYVIGSLGFLLPFTFNYFVKITPIALLVNFILLFSFHKHKINIKSILVFVSIFLLGLIVEIIGVKTGKIFGIYHYGNSLGFKIFSVPVMIGINWVFMVYSSSSVLEKFKFNNFVKILLSSTLMVVYDTVLEQVAPKLDMWYWENNHAPLKNYIAWFVLAIIFNSLIKIFRIKTSNKLALTIFLCQFVFFSVLMIKFLIF